MTWWVFIFWLGSGTCFWLSFTTIFHTLLELKYFTGVGLIVIAPSVERNHQCSHCNQFAFWFAICVFKWWLQCSLDPSEIFRYGKQLPVTKWKVLLAFQSTVWAEADSNFSKHPFRIGLHEAMDKCSLISEAVWPFLPLRLSLGETYYVKAF